ncbi:MBL fold metallo-hydrolase [Pontibacter sp. BT731]|uniref:MBL fold metallo-hydrolase n=1 Tax=Pontibacter coccineus TaxID=3063328 RepID=UPI0026E1DA4E|nr:MBL fold metallo-hydrolase [Pontibacter sp. BT731]MDO6391568.1 MBL fold metallo-hydrolase [Pontibacter sp. BT731]
METNYRTPTHDSKEAFAVAPGVWGLKTILVNLYFVTAPDGSWVLVDTGLYGAADKIRKVVDELYGGKPPKAILLTHGHFDHIGAVKELAREWDVPVYAHQLEMPYLNGKSSYPPPDPSVGGGGVAYMSFLYPKKPIDIHEYLEFLPADGSVPGLPDWHWIHTPGHTAGHVSFFRDSDRVLLAGDAFVTRHGESLLAVMSQKREVHGPPKYYTSDWGAAHHSVERLMELNPSVAATGHGMPMEGVQLMRQLEELVKDFWSVAVPSHGRYVHEPAITDEQGVLSVPPATDNTIPKVMAATGLVALAGVALVAYSRRNRDNNRKQHERAMRERPFSHNRPMQGIPPTVPATLDEDDPIAHTNHYP